jgi:hypothetical protein
MITFTKEQLIASAQARIEFAEMMLAGELEPLKERTWSIELELARIALVSLEAEHVAWIVHARTGDQLTADGGYVANAEGILGLHSTPLYTTPPTPEVHQEPIAWLNDAYLARGVVDGEAGSEDAGPGYIPIYREPLYAVQPAPVVPDEQHRNLSEIYHEQEKRLFKLAQRIKGPSFDKYAHSSSQAIDVLELALFGEREDEDSRAAMLQGKTNQD